MTADVVPIGIPSRAELWRRLQLARAVLNHRPSNTDTIAVVMDVLNGVTVDRLVEQHLADEEAV